MKKPIHRFVAGVQALCALLLGALLLAISAPAVAEEYRYVYVGNSFDMYFSHFQLPPDSPYSEYTTTGRIVVELTSQSPLTAGTSLSDVGWFRLSVQAANDPYHHFNVATPLVPAGSVCCGVWHELSGGLTIGAVDANGLPTDWNLWLQDYFITPNGRHQVTTISTTDEADSFSAGNQIGYSAYGNGDRVGGTWLLMAVPEPSSYALMIAGLATLGAWARRRARLNGSGPQQASGQRA